MKVHLPYRQDTVTVDIKTERCAGVLYPNEVPRYNDASVLHKALENPSGSPAFSDFIAGKDEILILVNDATRPTPTARILEILRGKLPLDRCQFLVATGSHKAPDKTELEWIFGELYRELFEAGRIHIHDARADEEMCFLGKSVAGTDVHINQLVAETEKIMVVTTVEPHYFGGYTGGRKSFLPGVTAYETIRQNHSLALRPEAANLCLRGNPVHEDMDSCLDLLENKQIFALQAVLDRHHCIHSVSTGDIRQSFQKAVNEANKIFCVDITSKADVVVSVAPYPMDIDLYQSQKAMENAKPALKPGGIMILLSSCRTGIGPETFFNLMSSCESPEAVMGAIRDEYKLGYHKAAKMVEACLLGEVWAVTDLPAEKLEKIFIRSWKDIQRAVDAALDITGSESKVLFIPEGSITVPRIHNSNYHVSWSHAEF
ncbi:nickel-dependent lactate racemase [bacterium]|nr:nickel-dependent lactate racemase [bacterium]